MVGYRYNDLQYHGFASLILPTICSDGCAQVCELQKNMVVCESSWLEMKMGFPVLSSTILHCGLDNGRFEHCGEKRLFHSWKQRSYQRSPRDIVEQYSQPFRSVRGLAFHLASSGLLSSVTPASMSTVAQCCYCCLKVHLHFCRFFRALLLS